MVFLLLMTGALSLKYSIGIINSSNQYTQSSLETNIGDQWAKTFYTSLEANCSEIFQHDVILDISGASHCKHQKRGEQTVLLTNNQSNLYQRGTKITEAIFNSHEVHQVIKNFKWEKFALFCSIKRLSLCQEIRESAQYTIPVYTLLSEDQNQFQIDQIVLKQIKNQSFKIMIAIVDDNLFQKIINALGNSLYTEGVGLLGIGNLALANSLQGALTLFEEIYEGISSKEDYFYRNMKRTLGLVKDLLDEGKATYQIEEILNQSQATLALYNLKENLEKIGQFENGALVLLNQPIFVGNSELVPQNYPSSILVSLQTNYNHLISLADLGNILSFQGCLLAIANINSSSEILPNQIINYNQISCNFNEAAEQQIMCMLQNDSKIGIAHILGFYSNYTATVKLLLAYLNSKFTIAPNYLFDFIDNNQMFPNYLSLMIPVYTYMVSSTLLLSKLQWNEILLLADQGATGDLFIENHKQFAQIQGRTIINKDKGMQIPENYTPEMYQEYKEVFDFIVESRCRVLAIFLRVPTQLAVAETLYDLGLRNGDIVMINLATSITQLSMYNGEESQIHKRVEVLKGSISLEFNQFAYEKGQKIQQQIQEIGAIANVQVCLFYDGIEFFARTIDYMLQRGLLYENPSLAAAEARKIHFQGCTGNVGISTGKNSRRQIKFWLLQVIKDDNQQFYQQKIGYVNPEAITQIELEKDFQWGDGTSNIPTNYRLKDDECLIKVDDIEDSDKGFYILCGVCALILVISGVLRYVLWRKDKLTFFDQLEQTVYISIDDMWAYASILINAIQMQALSLPVSSLIPQLETIFKLFLFNPETLAYFMRIDTEMVFIYLLAFLTVVVCAQIAYQLKLQERYEVPIVCVPTRIFINSYLPQIYKAFFISLVYSSLSVFDCKIGDGQNELYMTFDCNVVCYEGRHLVLSILIGITFIIFIVFEAIQDYSIQETQQSLNINVQTTYCKIHYFLQLVAVINALLLKEKQQIMFLVIYFVILASTLFLLFTIRSHTYNRFTIWARFALICNILITISVILANLGQFVVQIILGVLVALLAGIFYFYQIKFTENKIISHKSRDYAQLMRFQFNMKYSVDTGIVLSSEVVRNKSLVS